MDRSSHPFPLPSPFLALPHRLLLPQVGLIHLCTFLLLLLSGERSFGVGLNAAFTSKLPAEMPLFEGSHAGGCRIREHASARTRAFDTRPIHLPPGRVSGRVRIPPVLVEHDARTVPDACSRPSPILSYPFTLACSLPSNAIPSIHVQCLTRARAYADLLLIVLHKLIVDGSPKLSTLYSCFLTIICNVTPYSKKWVRALQLLSQPLLPSSSSSSCALRPAPLLFSCRRDLSLHRTRCGC